MANTRLYINKKTVKKNGTVAVYALIHLNNKTTKINTGVSVLLDKFDEKKGRIKGNSKEVKDNNLIIDKCLSQINEIFVRYRLQNRELTPDLLIREYKNPTFYIDFYAFLDKQISERVSSKELQPSSGRHHRVLLNKLKDFKSNLSFTEIDLKLISQFQKYCRVTKKNDINTVHKMLSYWQTYMNIAKRNEIISSNPFDNFQFNRIATQREFLTERELKSLVELYDDEEIKNHLQRTLRHFLFMRLTGIRISDLIRLKKENIQENALKFIPHKTHSRKRKELHIPIVDKAQILISDETENLTDYVFNTISEQQMNNQLKVIAKIAGLQKKITNHSARHTFATLFLEKTSDVATLQRILGHTNIRETMLYVHIGNGKINSQMDNFNKLLPF